MYGYMRSAISTEPAKPANKSSINQRRSQPVFKSRRRKKPGFFQRLRRNKPFVDNKEDEKQESIFDSNEITNLHKNAPRNSYIHMDPVDSYVDEICGSSNSNGVDDEAIGQNEDHLPSIPPLSPQSSFQSNSDADNTPSTSTGKSLESIDTSTFDNDSTWTVNVVHEIPKITLKEVLKDVAMGTGGNQTPKVEKARIPNDVEGEQRVRIELQNNGIRRVERPVSSKEFHDDHNIGHDKRVDGKESTSSKIKSTDQPKDDFISDGSNGPLPPSESTSEVALPTEETDGSEEIYKPQIVLRPKKVKDQLIQQINSIYHRYSMKRKESMIEVEDTIRHSLYDIQYTTTSIEFSNENCGANTDVEKTFHEARLDSMAFYLIERPVDRDIMVVGIVKDTVNDDVRFELTEIDAIFCFDQSEDTANCQFTRPETSIEYGFFAVSTEYFDLHQHETSGETAEIVLTQKSSEYESLSYGVTCLNLELKKAAFDGNGETLVIPSITQLEGCEFSVTTVENDFNKSAQAAETGNCEVTVGLTAKDTCSFSVNSIEQTIQVADEKNCELLEVTLAETVTGTPISSSVKPSTDPKMEDHELMRLIELSGQSSENLINRDDIESKEPLPSSQEDSVPPLTVDVDVGSEESGAYSEVSLFEHLEISPPLILKNCRKCACACWRTNVTQSNSYSEVCRCFEMEKEAENKEDNMLVNSIHLEEKIEKNSGEYFGEISKRIGTVCTETLFFGATSTEIVLEKKQDENVSGEALVFHPIKQSATETMTISGGCFELTMNIPDDKITEITFAEEQCVKDGFQLCISQTDVDLFPMKKADRSQNAEIFIPEVTVEQVNYSENFCDIQLHKSEGEKNDKDGHCKVNMAYNTHDTQCLSITSCDALIASLEQTEYVCHDIKSAHDGQAILSLTDLLEQFNKPGELLADDITLPTTMSDIISYSEIKTDVDFANTTSETMNCRVTWDETMFYQVSLAVTWIDSLLMKPQMSECVERTQTEVRKGSTSLSMEKLDSLIRRQDDACTVCSTWLDKRSEKSFVDLKLDVSYKEIDPVKQCQTEETEAVRKLVDTDSNFSRESAVITYARSMSPSIASTSNTMSEVPEDPFHDFNDGYLLKYGEMLPMPICRSVSSMSSAITVSEGEETLKREDVNRIVKEVLDGLVEKVIESHLEQFEKRFSVHARSSPARLNLMSWFDNSDLVHEQIAEVQFRHAIKFGVPKPVMFSDEDDLPISDDEYGNPSMDDSSATITSNTSKLVLNSSVEEQNGKNPEQAIEPENNGTAQPENGSSRPSEPLGLGGSNVPPLVQPAQANGAGKTEDSDEQAVDEEAVVFKNANIVVSIRAYEKKSEGFNAYIVYKIETRVSGIPNYTKSMNEVWRRFSDFLGLRDKLVEKYQHKGVAIPLAPEKSLAALTKTKLNTTNDEGYTTDVAEKRARLLERFLRRLCRSPRLVVDCDVVDFLTLDANLPKATFTAALSAKSMQKIFKSFGDALNKIAYPMDENDRWFEQMHGNVEELDDMLVRLHSIVDQLGSFRRELSQSSDSLSKSLSMIASCEENTALARTLSKLAETKENLSVVQKHEADTDSQILAEAIQEHLHMTQVLKELFFERVKAWQNWQTLRQNLAKKRELKARFDLAGRSDRANVAKAEVEACEQRVDEMEQDFQEMSKTIRREYIRLCKERRTDLKQAFIAYLEALVESEQHILEHWQKFGPEVQSII
ncbi:unnamed protein product [Bursaphelenchus xylophilus]|uniref:(pine wood nematode) hypothetical protein n=1 Tax=Bursaphelenchus xylophilus TaxID=6326 RepID=A0A1I7S801_BURXY|nr:unnamed protein product [Bursaphelenchus xylophilus]CAG9087296.1 unnamed protein product [Bursaphelenchus xylophilus]